MSSYRVFRAPAHIEMVEKKSRFIGLGYPCRSLDEFSRLLEEVQCEYDDASHVTYAYRIREAGQLVVRFYDAGEPSGTAGRPILSHLEGQNLVDAALFVVRYFGGVKLGAGGLVRAYGGTAKLLLQTAPIGELLELETLSFDVPYPEQTHFEYILGKCGGRTLERAFSTRVRMRVEIPKSMRDEFVATASFAQLVTEPS